MEKSGHIPLHAYSQIINNIHLHVMRYEESNEGVMVTYIAKDGLRKHLTGRCILYKEY